MTIGTSARRLGRPGRRIRLVATLAAATMAATAVPACSSGSSGSTDSSSSGKTLTIQSLWAKGQAEGIPFYQAVSKWEQQTGNKVAITETGENTPKVYETNVAANKEADVVIVNVAGTSAGWVRNGYAEPVAQYLDSWGLRSAINPSAVADWTVAGKVLGFPYAGFTWPMWFNMALLKKAGIDTVPTTTSELITDAAKLTAAGIQPVAIGGNDWSGNKLFFQIIQSFMSKDQATTLFEKGGYCADPSAMKGIDLFDQLRDSGVFAKNSQGLTADQMNSLFFAGKAAMMPAGNWAFGQAPASVVPEVQLGGFPVPADGTFTKPTAYQGFTGAGFWISPKGKKSLSLVESFIKFMYTPAILSSFVTMSGTVLAANTATSAASSSHPLLVKALSTLPSTVEYAVFPDTTVPPNAQDAAIRATSQAYISQTSAQTTCKALDQAYGN
jgi:multiple sugar transport system substrate-binding protein